MSNEYTTVQGDTWDGIAKRLWGKETLMHKLLEANPDHADVLIFDPDVRLRVPQVTIPTKVLDLPPWYSGSAV